MTTKDNKEYAVLILSNLVMLLILIILLVVGTFNDKVIAESLFSPDNLFIKYVTSLGVFPFFSFAVLFMGALCERIIYSKSHKVIRIILAALCYAIAIFVGFIGAGSLVDKDCLGNIYPQLNRNIPVIVGICTFSNTILLTLGFRLAKKNDDETLMKKIIVLLILLALSYALMQIFKGVFHRPRYRLVVKEYEGIGYIPWYQPFSGAEGFIESLGIDKGEFRSFPSGHSILSMSMVYILQSLSWFSDKLRDKRFLLGVCGLIFSVIICFTRLILGAHYLSDVSMGAIIATLFGLIYLIIQKRIDS